MQMKDRDDANSDTTLATRSITFDQHRAQSAASGKTTSEAGTKNDASENDEPSQAKKLAKLIACLPRPLSVKDFSVSHGGDMYNDTALHLLHKMPDEKLEACLTHLLSAGADINARDYEGDTPLMYAACFGNAKYFSLLMQHRADLTLKNGSGRTALERAMKRKQKDIVEMLGGKLKDWYKF